MHRIDSDGATLDNKFTEGNPALSIPATVVSAAIMNALQEEVATLIEAYGITLLTSGTDTFTQLKTALEKMTKLGGRSAPITFSVVNNQASFADVTGFPQIDRAVTKAFEFLFTIERKTDTNKVKETGRGFATWDSVDLAWSISLLSAHDDAGVTFQMVLVSGTSFKLQYSSTNISGASYLGTLKITDIKEILA